MGCGLCQRWSCHQFYWHNTFWILSIHSMLVSLPPACCLQHTLSLTNSSSLPVTTSDRLEWLGAAHGSWLPLLCSPPTVSSTSLDRRCGPAPVSPHRPLWNCLKLTQHVTTPSCHQGPAGQGTLISFWIKLSISDGPCGVGVNHSLIRCGHG